MTPPVEAAASMALAVEQNYPGEVQGVAITRYGHALPTMKIRVVEFATSLKEAEEGRFQAYMLNWSGRPDPDGNLYIFAKSKAPQNYGGYSSPEVDAWLDEARTKSDPAERKAIYEKVAEKFLKEGSLMYLFHRRWFVAHTAKLQGMKLLPDGLVRVVGLKLAP